MAENFLTRKLGPLPAWGWAGVGIGVYVIWRLRKNQQASAASTTPATMGSSSGYGNSTGTGEPQASLSTPGGFQYSGPASYLTNPSLSSLFSNPTPAVAATPGSTQTSSVASPQTITIGGAQYDILGLASSPGYQVYGGAPVFYGNANSISQGYAAQQAALKSGGYEYVPATYSNLVYATGSPHP